MEELERVATLVRNMGRLGISVLCYNWSAVLGWLRTELALRGRGGAIVAGFDHRRLKAAPAPRLGTADEQDLWDNLHYYFLERIVPSPSRPASGWPCTPTTRRCHPSAGSPGSFARSTRTSVCSFMLSGSRPTSPSCALAFRLAERNAAWSMATHDGRLREAVQLAHGPAAVEQLLGVRPDALNDRPAAESRRASTCPTAPTGFATRLRRVAGSRGA